MPSVVLPLRLTTAGLILNWPELLSTVVHAEACIASTTLNMAYIQIM